MAEQITISGESFNVPSRYVEGHVLTAAEASALDQTYHENLRNNFTKRVKELQANGGYNQAAAQAELDTYAQTYVFGKRRSKGTAHDPIMVEARAEARRQIAEFLKTKGVKLGQVKASALAEKEQALIARDPSILETAKAKVAAAQAAAQKDLSDLVGDLPLKEAGATA